MPRVVRFYQTGGPEVLKIETVDVPKPAAGEVRIAVKALGLNRAESMFRLGQYLEQPQFSCAAGLRSGRHGRIGRGRRERFETGRRRQHHSGLFAKSVRRVWRPGRGPGRRGRQASTITIVGQKRPRFGCNISRLTGRSSTLPN